MSSVVRLLVFLLMVAPLASLLPASQQRTRSDRVLKVLKVTKITVVDAPGSAPGGRAREQPGLT